MRKAFLSSQSGFAIVELSLVLFVLAILGAGVYFLKTRSIRETTVIPTPKTIILPTEKDILPQNELDKTTTIFPTTTPAPVDSGDEDLDAVGQDLNQLEQEINTLDQLDSDLTFPEVNFSE